MLWLNPARGSREPLICRVAAIKKSFQQDVGWRSSCFIFTKPVDYICIFFCKTILSLDSQRSFLVALEFGRNQAQSFVNSPRNIYRCTVLNFKGRAWYASIKAQGVDPSDRKCRVQGVGFTASLSESWGLKIWGYDMMCFKQMVFESVKMLYKKDVKAKNQLDSLKNHHVKALGEARERVCLVSADPGAIIVAACNKFQQLWLKQNFWQEKRYRKRIFPWDWHHYIQVQPQDLMKATGAVKFCFFSGCPVG